jgi:hypothetical protein
MPIHKGKDSNGYFYQWGHQKKYYYNPYSQHSQNQAYLRAVQQAKAIYSHGYKRE